jgi:predicted dehydrogenase
MARTIAVIGCGRIGSSLEDDPLRAKPASHIGAIRQLPETLRLTAICDSDRHHLLQCQQRWSVPKFYLDYRELILKENPDIVSIATWTSSHMEIASFAAENGVRGIVLEKPMALDLAQADLILSACRRHKVALVINHERRWDPLYRKVREIIQSNELGALRTVTGNVLCGAAAPGSWKSMIDEVGGGPLLHDGTHLVDLVRWLAGDVSQVTGRLRRDDQRVGVETTALAWLQTDGDVPVFIEAGGMRNYFNFELDLQFENGRLRVGNGIRDFLVAVESKRYSGFRDLERRDFPPLDSSLHPFRGAFEEVTRALDDASEPFSSGLDGRKALEIIFAIYYSASLRGKTISLPLNASGHPLKKMFASGML